MFEIKVFFPIAINCQHKILIAADGLAVTPKATPVFLDKLLTNKQRFMTCIEFCSIFSTL